MLVRIPDERREAQGAAGRVGLRRGTERRSGRFASSTQRRRTQRRRRERRTHPSHPGNTNPRAVPTTDCCYRSCNCWGLLKRRGRLCVHASARARVFLSWQQAASPDRAKSRASNDGDDALERETDRECVWLLVEGMHDRENL